MPAWRRDRRGSQTARWRWNVRRQGAPDGESRRPRCLEGPGRVVRRLKRTARRPEGRVDWNDAGGELWIQIAVAAQALERRRRRLHRHDTAGAADRQGQRQRVRPTLAPTSTTVIPERDELLQPPRRRPLVQPKIERQLHAFAEVQRPAHASAPALDFGVAASRQRPRRTHAAAEPPGEPDFGGGRQPAREAHQMNLTRRAANKVIRISSKPWRQRWMFVVP